MDKTKRDKRDRERILSSIVIDRDALAASDDSPCWTSSKKPGSGGYVRVQFGGRLRYQHVVVYELLRDQVPEGMTLDHKCHDPEVCRLGRKCPHRACCNPAHLAPETGRVNTLRGNSPHALNARKDCCPACSSEFTELPGGSRRCDACARTRASAWYEENHERGLQARREYRAAHLDDIREYDRSRARNGTEERKQYHQDYYQANKERVRAQQKASHRTEAMDIRDWARAQGIDVPGTGRLSPKLKAAYREAKGGG